MVGSRDRRRFGVAITAFGLLLAGCAQKALPPYVAGDAPAVAGYKLGAGDKIRIDTFGEASLSGEFEISGAGDIALPLLGPVPAAGRTTTELSDAIMLGLRAGNFLKNPRVGVQMLNYRPFYILGEVVKPGAYPFSNGMTVLAAVATAGGFTYRANSKRLFIRHMGEPAEQDTMLTAATPVMPGDTIRVGERHF